MKLSREIYEKMINCQEVPPEIGGILGATGGKINRIVFDKPQDVNPDAVTYAPNLNYLNRVLEEWCEEGIQFMGIFHTHAENWKGLSGGDRMYIEVIIQNMPEDVKELFFPVVYPQKNMDGFVARRKKEKIEIVQDSVEIL